MRRIYLDNSATTHINDEVMSAMQPYNGEKFGNASSLYMRGRESAEAIEKAREQVAGAIGADTKEVIFTSGGTESDNIALIGAAHANREHGDHIITSSIEHPAVMETVEHLKLEGYSVTHVPVDKEGILNVDALSEAITPTRLRSLYACEQRDRYHPAHWGSGRRSQRRMISFFIRTLSRASARST